MPACNKELPAFDIELLRQQNKQRLQQQPRNNNQYLSPSPSPVPPDDLDVEIDPDNMVVSGSDRQSYTPSPALSVHGNPPNDHDFNMHTYVSLFVDRAMFCVYIFYTYFYIECICFEFLFSRRFDLLWIVKDCVKLQNIQDTKCKLYVSCTFKDFF